MAKLIRLGGSLNVHHQNSDSHNYASAVLVVKGFVVKASGTIAKWIKLPIDKADDKC